MGHRAPTSRQRNPADVLVGQPAARANDNDEPSRRPTSTAHVGVTAAPSELDAYQRIPMGWTACCVLRDQDGAAAYVAGVEVLDG